MTRPSRRGKLIPLPDSASDADGTVDGDVIDWPTSGYDDVVAQDAWKQPVDGATTADLVISTDLIPGEIIDGITLVDGMRWLVKNELDESLNGIWIVADEPFRAPDMDDPDEFLGAIVYVIGGTANEGTTWRSELTDAPSVGTDPVTFAEFGSSGEPIAIAHVADTTDAHDASAVSIADAGGYYASTDVEGALQELGSAGDLAYSPVSVTDDGGDHYYLLCDGDGTPVLIEV